MVFMHGTVVVVLQDAVLDVMHGAVMIAHVAVAVNVTFGHGLVVHVAARHGVVNNTSVCRSAALPPSEEM